MDKLYVISDKDHELYNLYSRMNTNELLDLGASDPIYRIAVFERVNDKGNTKSFAQMSTSGFLPILASFPDFDRGLDFIESFKPGFRYSKYFTDFKKSHLKVVVEGDNTIYTLGKYRYIVNKWNEEILSERWYRDDVFHNEFGPAHISYASYKENGVTHYYKYSEQYYINGVLNREDQYYPGYNNPLWKSIIYDDRRRRVKYSEYYPQEGTIKSVRFYDNGEPIFIINYSRDGNKTSEITVDEYGYEDYDNAVYYNKDGEVI